ncbi:M15 family metallopeptidase [Ramlibacter ginsenosidimutans]|uniref:M15 family metallopeptidase n=1 Tax=Ramlibacter ginsenosidimutans TaxID=502333 RepID=A0A934WM97_9BURK|nr:M15 family metallopeptidase [Ramlibacter ginsenosidimutans]MBK6006411.1 M15 family metallopeptidase [Ramlibacter ginsenosidimutans]
MDATEMIEAVQKALGVDVDGRAGPETWTAIYAAVVNTRKAAAATPLTAFSRVDERSERNIATLLPEVQPMARMLVQKAAANGIDIRVISGLRSYEEQDALYAQGRTAPGNIVTKARGGYSNHNFGIAFDVGVFSGSKYLPESPKYKAVGVLGQELGLEWGGSWTSLVDEPHFQLRPAWARSMNESSMLAELRQRRQDSEPVYA